MKVVAAIPTLNPSEKILTVVQELRASGFSHIIIVNDGSDVDRLPIFVQLEEMGCTLLTHSCNRGKGAGIKTILQAAKERFPDAVGVITLDDDGQHLTEDVVATAKALEAAPDSLVLGCRNFGDPNVPPKSRFGNRLTSAVFRLFCGLTITDTQTGLRGIPRSQYAVFLETAGERFEYETRMLLDTKLHRIPILEVPIHTVYHDQNAATHFHPIRDSWRIYKQLFAFFLSSTVSFLVDIGLFAIFTMLLPIESQTVRVVVSGFLARAISSVVNFMANKRMVFQSDCALGHSLFKYYLLCVAQISVSSLLTAGLAKLFPSLLYLWKILVDGGLFFASYRIQKTLVFQEQEKKEHRLLRNIGRGFAVLGTMLGSLLLLIVAAITVVFHGPSPAMQGVLVNTFIETSALKWIPSLYFSADEVQAMVEGNQAQIDRYLAALPAASVEINIVEPTEQDSDGITIEEVVGDTFVGKMVIVADPSRISLRTLDSFAPNKEGLLVRNVAMEEGVTIAMNGGGFFDDRGNGRGGLPAGIVISGGKLLSNTPSMYPTMIGFDANHHLIVDNVTGEQALAMGVTDAVSFGPVLVKNGNVVPQKASGFNPRTAIGQRADGALLLLIIDGRQPHSLGATYNDLAQVMGEFGAVNAGNLDGGSSSLLFYQGKMINALASAVGERPIPTVFVVK